MIKNILQSLIKLIIGAGPFGALSVFYNFNDNWSWTRPQNFFLYWR